MKSTLILGLAALLGGVACDTPAASKKKPSTPVAPVQKAQILNAGTPSSQPVAPSSQPAAATPAAVPTLPAAPAEPAAQSQALKGTIEVAPDLAAKLKAGVVFVMARPVGGGMPIAVTKLTVNQPSDFPLDFALTAQNVMIAGTPLTGEVLLQARLDGDGDAMSKLPGDLHGQLPKVTVGGAPVKLILDKSY